MPPGAVSLYSFRYAFYNYMCAGGAKNAARRGMGHNDSSRSGEGFYANTLMGFSSSMLYRGDKRVQVFNPGMCVALRAGERDAPVSRVDVAGAVEEDAEVLTAVAQTAALADNVTRRKEAAVRRRVEDRLVLEVEAAQRLEQDRAIWGRFTYDQDQGAKRGPSVTDRNS